MKVHNALGPGLKEEHYEKALSAEFQEVGIPRERQKAVAVRLDNKDVAVLVLDLLVNDQLVVEVKARQWLLTDDEVGQVITYLKATSLNVGLLVNFGRRRLDYKRIFPPKRVQEHPSRAARYNVSPKDKPEGHDRSD